MFKCQESRPIHWMACCTGTLSQGAGKVASMYRTAVSSRLSQAIREEEVRIHACLLADWRDMTLLFWPVTSKPGYHNTESYTQLGPNINIDQLGAL